MWHYIQKQTQNAVSDGLLAKVAKIVIPVNTYSSYRL